MIRKATMDDLTECVRLAIEFFQPFMERHGVPVVESDVRAVAINTINEQRMVVIDRDGVRGMAAWMVIGHPANSSLKIFYETIWAVKSEVRTDCLLLLREMERRAELLGANIISIANLSEKNEKQLSRIFGTMGYEFLETHYSKKLT